MIYFDNAATTWPKPPEVSRAMVHCLQEIGANPGRAGHQMAIEANAMVDGVRKKLAGLFKIDEKDHDRLVFTLNATGALNLGLKGSLKSGDHVITSSMEHNSVGRPLNSLERDGVEVTRVRCDGEGRLDPDEVRRALKSNTKMIVMTHASNVTGAAMPLKEIGRLAGEAGVILMVDAAQTAGVLDIDVKSLNISLLAFPGHKSLLGPTGTGGLYVKRGITLDPVIEGGTGSQSELPDMPETLPERYEAGTLNTVGIAGLGAGIDFILREGMKKIRDHELSLTKRFIDGAQSIPGLKIYGPRGQEGRAPVVSFLIEGRETAEIGGVLDKNYGVACRAGLHCAPEAHRTLGTVDQKLVRFSFSYFNTPEEVDRSLSALDQIVRQKITLPEGQKGGCSC